MKLYFIYVEKYVLFKTFESIIKKNNINICLESYLLKFINIITVFCKADNFKKEMLDSESIIKIIYSQF